MMLTVVKNFDDSWALASPGGLLAHFGGALVEGTGAQMWALATAIEQRRGFQAKRCAVRIDDGAVLWSPRNSVSEARIPLSLADDLAKNIKATIPKPKLRLQWEWDAHEETHFAYIPEYNVMIGQIEDSIHGLKWRGLIGKNDVGFSSDLTCAKRKVRQAALKRLLGEDLKL